MYPSAHHSCMCCNNNNTVNRCCQFCSNHPPHHVHHHGTCHPPPSTAYYWMDTQASSPIPITAVRGGHDSDGHAIYVGKASHNGDWLPAKVIPGKKFACVSYNGKEHVKKDIQVLCGQGFDWVRNHGGYVPPGAVEGGRTSNGEILYIGRVSYQRSLTVGKVHPSHGVLYIPYGCKEHSFTDYEILVHRG